MREKKLMEKPFHIRLGAATDHKLRAIAKRTGVDPTTIARMALNHGLPVISRTLPATPDIDDVSNASGQGSSHD